MKKGILVILLLALLTSGAQAMTQERAEALVKAADPRAEKARRFWVYPEGEGAWVFYGTGYNSSKALFKGGFWYVTEEKQTQLGEYTENVLDWGYTDGETPLFYSITVYGADQAWHPHAALLKDGAPFEIEDFGALVDLDGYNDRGSLVGYTAHDAQTDPGWVFLGVQDDHLVEIAATPISEAEALGFYDMNGILEELAKDTFFGPEGETRVTEYLFRNAYPGRCRNSSGIVQGSITLNVENNGKPGHLCVFIDENGVAYPMRGWESELAIDDGAAKARYDVGLEIVETVTE